MKENLKKRLRFGILVLVIALLPVCLLSARFLKKADTDRSFTAFTDELFREEICGSTLNLHYTISNPNDFGILEYPITFGSLSTETNTEGLTHLLLRLQEFDMEKLSEENRLTCEILQYYWKNQLDAAALNLLYEPLSPSLGIQAQLPVLLAEYTFRTPQDLLDYLALLKETDTYFSQILAFEQKRSESGLFMSDLSVQRVIEQCTSFIQEPENNYLQSLFSEKLEKLDITADEKSAALTTHKNLLKKHVIPAYKSIISGLNALKGTGTNNGGLCGYPNGKEYYQYLLRTQSGVTETPEALWQRLTRQLASDLKDMQELLQADPTIIGRKLKITQDPDEILKELQKKISDDFPPLESPEYEVKYVPDALKDYLSPAFYLTPPVDTGTPNAIYLNPAGNLEGIELFTTLAHEAFPGHLYQTRYFAETEPNLLRTLYEPSGYIEGWATYTESYAYSYAGEDAALSRLLWLNRSSSLCLYSLMDIGIHYFDWEPEDTAAFLEDFGITDPATAAEAYQYIVETPGNYLKYYVGYLHFLDLKTGQQEKLGEDFDLKEFHRKILEIGPCPFDILKKYLEQKS